jgi:TPR repeat protein
MVGSEISVRDSSDIMEQRDICFREWPSVLKLALECRSAGVAMLIHSCKGKSRSGSLASLCLSYLNFPGCQSILGSHLIVAKARPCVQSCNPAYLRWAQMLLADQRCLHHDVDSESVKIERKDECAALSWLLIDGKCGIAKDFKKAFEVAMEGNRLNCVHSRGALARCYFAGRGVTQDTELALNLARESAAAGSCYGHFVLGTALFQGGTHQDYIRAISHWRIAAAQGLAAAQHNLGTMYTTGRGLPLDHGEALKLYNLAASQEYSPAQYSLGHVYENGLGVPVDLLKAFLWYQFASLHSEGEFYGDAVAGLDRLNLTRRSEN